MECLVLGYRALRLPTSHGVLCRSRVSGELGVGGRFVVRSGPGFAGRAQRGGPGQRAGRCSGRPDHGAGAAGARGAGGSVALGWPAARQHGVGARIDIAVVRLAGQSDDRGFVGCCGGPSGPWSARCQRVRCGDTATRAGTASRQGADFGCCRVARRGRPGGGGRTGGRPIRGFGSGDLERPDGRHPGQPEPGAAAVGTSTATASRAPAVRSVARGGPGNRMHRWEVVWTW